VEEWFRTHGHGSINEEQLPTVDVTKTILQAEIRPGMFKIIDGNHRIEKAFRDGILYIQSYKLRGEQLIPYFYEGRGLLSLCGLLEFYIIRKFEWYLASIGVRQRKKIKRKNYFSQNDTPLKGSEKKTSSLNRQSQICHKKQNEAKVI
jgi:hypothetical protein